MKGVFKMYRTVLLLSLLCGLVRSSGVEHAVSIADAPVVTAASSQYFERTFNRLVVPQVVTPVAPPPLQPVFPVAPPPPVFVEPARTVPVAVNPPPSQGDPGQPNIAIAVATAHAAAPVATILLPPYPFGLPPTFGFIPPEQPINVPDDNNKEPTTQSTTRTQVTTTQEPEATTPIPSSSDDNFVQAQPSNENVNFNQYGPPLPPQSRPRFQPQPQQPLPQFQPQPQQPRPQFQPQPLPQPQQPRPQFQPQPQQPLPQFQPQPQQPRPQFQPQPRPQFQPQPQPQFQSQPQPRPQYQPQPQPRPQYQPQPEPRPQYQPSPYPQSRPQQPWPQNIPRRKPQKLKTSVEVVPVPLAYISPPPSKHHHHHHHGPVKVVKHVYSFIPVSSSKIILRQVPAKLVAYKSTSNERANVRDIELTTFQPFPRPSTKPPRIW